MQVTCPRCEARFEPTGAEVRAVYLSGLWDLVVMAFFFLVVVVPVGAFLYFGWYLLEH